MKYCPYCGAEVIDGAVSFCTECGKELPAKKAKTVQESSPPDRSGTKKKNAGKRPAPVPDAQLRAEYDEGYDGYYEDLLPIDDGEVYVGKDRELTKKIIILGVAVVLVILLCVMMMYLL